MRKLLIFFAFFYGCFLLAQEPVSESNSFVYNKLNYGFDFYNIVRLNAFSDGSIDVSPYSYHNITLGNTFAHRTFKNDSNSSIQDFIYLKNRTFINDGNCLYEALKDHTLKKIFIVYKPEVINWAVCYDNSIYIITYNTSIKKNKIYIYDGNRVNNLLKLEMFKYEPTLHYIDGGLYIQGNDLKKQSTTFYKIEGNKLIPAKTYPFYIIHAVFTNFNEFYYDDRNVSIWYYKNGKSTKIFKTKNNAFGFSIHQNIFTHYDKNIFYLLKMNKNKVDTLANIGNISIGYASLFNKETNSYYVGTGTNFIRLFPYFRKYPKLFNKSNSQQIFSILQAKDGKIWAGSYNGALSFVEKKKVVPSNFNYMVSNGGLRVGDKIILNSEGGKGLYLFDDEKHFKKINDTIINFYNFISKDSTLYCGTSNWGMMYAKWKDIVSRKKINWKFIGYKEGNSLVNNLCIVEDRFGNIWSSQRGISVFQPYKNRAVTWSKEKNEIGFSSKTILMDSHNTLWAGSYDGKLYYYNGKSRDDLSPKNFIPIHHPFFEADKNITFLHQWKNYLVIGASDKILLFDLEKWYHDKKVSIRYLNAMETNFSAQTEQNTVLTDFRDESIWFSTSDMLYQWNIKDWLKLPTFKVIPEIVIKKDTIENHLQANQSFKFKPRENSFDIEIRYQTKDNMPRYISASLVKEGEKPVFEAPNLETHFKFQNLRSGNYEFYVRVCQQDGRYDIYEYQLKIERFLWQNWWFWLLVSLFPIAVIFYYFRQKNASEKQKKQISQLNLSNLSNQFRPHFMLNALNSIGSQMEDKPHAEKVISRLGESINILYDFTTKKAFYHDFEKEWKLVSNVIEIQKLLFIPDLQSAIHHLEIMSPDFKIPIGLIQIPVENALLHGLRNREESPYLLEINFSENEEQLIISIKDNGVGRKKSMEMNNFKKNGNGLKNIQEMVNIINKRESNAVRFEIKDLKEGTEVVITLSKTIDYEKIQL